jgi:type I restriction enzyme S subunit
MSWELKSFDELGFIGRGKSRHRPRNDESLYGGEFPLIQTGDVKNANLYITEYSQTYSQKGLDQSKLWEPNTLCITIAANIADTTILGIQACFPDSIIGFVADENVCDVRFIKYHFDIVQKQMQMVSQGATQDNLSLEKLLKFKVATPPLETQKRISSILSTYDNLIENNLKRIKLLEETAQNIYKEWFVNFRFPNYEHTEFDAESGLPVGWEKKRLDEIYEFQNGYAFYTNGYSEEATPYIVVDLGNISESGDFVVSGKEKFISESLYQDKERYYLNKYDVVVAMTDMTARLGILAKVGIIDENDKYVLNQRVGRLRSKIAYIDYCYVNASLSDERFISEMHQRSKGAVQKYFNTKDIIEYIVVVPSKHIIDEFNILYRPIIENRIALKFQNQKLKEASDILLPRLMNRTIEV